MQDYGIKDFNIASVESLTNCSCSSAFCNYPNEVVIRQHRISDKMQTLSAFCNYPNEVFPASVESLTSCRPSIGLVSR